jgi:hypothetical protein
MDSLSPEHLTKLDQAKNIWFASVRPDGRPHLAPVWFAFYGGRLYVSIEATSVKGRNIQANPQVALALEEGIHPVICEGRAAPVVPPYPAQVLEIFQKKYDWDLNTENQYSQLVEIIPLRWLAW